MTVALDKLDAFAHRFEALARECPAETFLPNGRVDSELSLDLVSSELLELLAEMEPCGPGNPTPTFAARRVAVTVGKAFGKEGNHLRLVLNDHISGVYCVGNRDTVRKTGEGPRPSMWFSP